MTASNKKIINYDKMAGKSYTILIIEEDKNFSSLIKTILNDNGIDTKAGYSGKEAISRIKSDSNCIILLDYSLPDMNGRDLIKTLKKKSYNIPFIIMTDNGCEDTAVEMMKLGALDYLIKDEGFRYLLPQVTKRAIGQVNIDNKLAGLEKLLRESEERFRDISCSMADWIWEVDRDWK